MTNRENFEYWLMRELERRGLEYSSSYLERDGFGYEEEWVNDCWIGWQARGTV